MHKAGSNALPLTGSGRRSTGLGVGIDGTRIGIQGLPCVGRGFGSSLGLGRTRGAPGRAPGCAPGRAGGCTGGRTGGGFFVRSGVILYIVSCTRHRNQHDRREDCRRGSAGNAATDCVVCFHLYDTIPFGRVHASQMGCGGLCRVGFARSWIGKSLHTARRERGREAHPSRSPRGESPSVRRMYRFSHIFGHTITDDTCAVKTADSFPEEGGCCFSRGSLWIVCAPRFRLHMENFGFESGRCRL